MTTHVIHHNAPNGDVTDIDWYCSTLCMVDALNTMGALDDGNLSDSHRFADGTSVDYGAHPCGSETDYDVHCGTCGALMWRGLDYNAAVYGDDDGTVHGMIADLEAMRERVHECARFTARIGEHVDARAWDDLAGALTAALVAADKVAALDDDEVTA